MGRERNERRRMRRRARRGWRMDKGSVRECWEEGEWWGNSKLRWEKEVEEERKEAPRPRSQLS